MPVYTYKCEECHKQYDELVAIDEPNAVECKHCGMPGVKRIMGTPSLKFRGTGFYATDYANNKKGKVDAKSTS